MTVRKGFVDTNKSMFIKTSMGDEVRAEAVNRLRRSLSLSTERAPVDRVMVIDHEGKTRDIVTGVPPSFSEEARSAWAKRREEASIEGLFE